MDVRRGLAHEGKSIREAGRRYGTGAGEMTVCKVIEDDAGIDLRVDGEWVKPWEVERA